MIPAFQRRDYDTGILGAVGALAGEYARELGFELTGPVPQAAPQPRGPGGFSIRTLVLLLLVVSGLAAWLRDLLYALTGLVLPAPLQDATVVVLMAVVILSLLQAVEFPFGWYQGFELEHRYGLSTQSGAHWLADQVKAAGVGGVLAVAGISVVFFTLRQWPSAWWAVSAAC